MAIPDIDHPNATVEERDIQADDPAPGDPLLRRFNIDHGPRPGDSPVIMAWTEDLLETEFEDANVIGTTAERLYVDTDYADWWITIEYLPGDLDTYRIPINNGTGAVFVDAADPADALALAYSNFEEESLTGHGSRATATLPISLPAADEIDEITVADRNPGHTA